MIEILDNAGNLVHSIGQAVVLANVFVLDAELQAGEGYQIRSGNEEPFLWRDDSGADVNFLTRWFPGQHHRHHDRRQQQFVLLFLLQLEDVFPDPCLSERVEFTVDVPVVDGIGNLPMRQAAGGHGGRHKCAVTEPRNRGLMLFSDGSVEGFVGERR